MRVRSHMPDLALVKLVQSIHMCPDCTPEKCCADRDDRGGVGA
jgi:hypothetical protein